MNDSDSPRDQAIIDLLRVYRDLEGGSSPSAGGGRGNDDRMLYMDGGDWEKSGCDALDDLLKRLRVERPSQWWHVTERYLRCEVRPRRVVMERTHSGNGRLPNPGAHAAYLGGGVQPTDSWLARERLVVVESWSKQVRAEKVRRGVRFLAVGFPWDNFRWRELTQALAA